MSHPQPSLQSLRPEIQSRYNLTPSDPWLTAFLNTFQTQSTAQSQSQTLQSLASKAHIQLLHSDITQSLSNPLSSNPSFPANTSDVNVKSLTLSTDVFVQVLEILDTSTSRYTQIEGIERIERGEEVKGREIVRTVRGVSDNENANGVGEDGDDDGLAGEAGLTGTTIAASTRGSGGMYGTAGSGAGVRQSTATNTNSGSSGSGVGVGSGSGSGRKGSRGPHKLLLQDCKGQRVWGFEMSRIEKITIVTPDPVLPSVSRGQGTGGIGGSGGGSGQKIEGMRIGCKFLLRRGAVVRRGMIMMVPENVAVLGGFVESWDVKWRSERKGKLKADMDNDAARQGDG